MSADLGAKGDGSDGPDLGTLSPAVTDEESAKLERSTTSVSSLDDAEQHRHGAYGPGLVRGRWARQMARRLRLNLGRNYDCPRVYTWVADAEAFCRRGSPLERQSHT